MSPTAPHSLRSVVPLIAAAVIAFGSPAGRQALRAQPAAVELPHFRLDIREHRLANGLTVLVQERPAAGRVGARMFYRSDIGGERPGTSGLTHLLEHYLFKGSHAVGTRGWEQEKELAAKIETLARQITDEKNRLRDSFRQRDAFEELEASGTSPQLEKLVAAYEAAVAEQDREFTLGTDAIRAYLFAGGTGFTASTGADWMKFDIDLPASRLELFMWMERDRITNPVFRQFDPEREVVIEQIRRSFNDPSGVFNRMLQSTTFEAHPYGWAHWFSDLQSATREDHWEIFYKYFIPQNTVMVIVGEVKAGEVFRLAERYFGDWPAKRPSPRLRTVEPVQAGQKRVAAEAPAGPTFAINVHTPATGHRDLPVLNVLAEVLGGRDGLLVRRLVRDSAIATAASASASSAKYGSVFRIRVSPRGNDDLAAVEDGVDAALREVAAGRVSADEIAAAVRTMHFNFIRNFEEIGTSAVVIGAQAAIHRWEYLNALPGLWARVTPQDLARVARTYFDPQRRTVGVLRRGRGTADWTSTSQPRPGEQAVESPAEVLDATTVDFVAGAGLGLRELNYEPPFLGELAPEHPARKAPGTLAGVTLETASADQRLSPVGLTRTPRTSGDAGHASVPAQPSTGDALAAPPAGPGQAGDPLAVGEFVWYAPPWMAVRRGAVEPAPSNRPAHYRDLKFPPAPFTPPGPASARIEIPNGITAFVVAEPLLPMVRVTAYVDATTVHDPAGKEGLAALALEMIERGGAGTRSGDEVAAALGAAGVRLTTDVTDLRTAFTLVMPVDRQNEVLDLLGQLVLHPRFDADEFEDVRSRTALRTERQRDTPGVVLNDLFASMVYGSTHPQARAATRASVETITLDDIKAFHAAYYRPERIALAVSGRVDRDALQPLLAASFAATQATAGAPDAIVPRVPPPGGAAGGTVRTVDRPAAQAQVMLGYTGIAGRPADHAALEVMHYVLAGGGFGSRMMDELRTRRGLTAALYGEVRPVRFGQGTYVWRFNGNPDTIAEAIRLALAEIERMRTGGVTEEEFENARTAYLEGHIPHAYDTAHARAERFAQARLLGLYEYISEQYLNYYAGDAAQAAALQKLTLADVNAAAKKYLRPEQAVIAIVGPLDRIQKGATAETRKYVGS